jgi:hypothetical protein
MPERPSHLAGHPAPISATYEQTNVFGSLTGIKIRVTHGTPLPGTPMGHGWTVVEEYLELGRTESPSSLVGSA